MHPHSRARKRAMRGGVNGKWRLVSGAPPAPLGGHQYARPDLARRGATIGIAARGQATRHPRPTPDSGQQPNRANRNPTFECSDHGHLMAVGALTAAASLSFLPAWDLGAFEGGAYADLR